MKKFEAPVVSIEELKAIDVIATSCPEDNGNGCDNDMGEF